LNYPADTPANANARARLAAFFARGGGYIGAGATGAAFLTDGGQLTGLTAATRGGAGRSGIVYWNNTGGSGSVVTGAYPAQDTAIFDPPTWFTAVPAGLSVDARFPLTGFFAAGLWLLDPASASARLADRRARDEHGRHLEGDGLRDESALPGRSGA
jgi:hypothetical protein